MSAEPLRIERDASGPFAGVVTVRLEQPGRPVVVLDHDLLRRMESTFAQIPADARGVVLASASERVFVAGADLKGIQDAPDDELARYLAYASRVYAMLLSPRCPTVAAINGAALGGGLELAMHCDGLVGCPSASGKPYPVGLPEASLGLCPGWGGTNLLPARIDPGEAIAQAASGRTMQYLEAVEAGLFDAVAPGPEELLEVAKRWVCERPETRVDREGTPLRWIGRPDSAEGATHALAAARDELDESDRSAAAVIDAVDAGLARGWRAAVEAEQRHLVSLRHEPRAREALRAFFEKSGAKKG